MRAISAIFFSAVIAASAADQVDTYQYTVDYSHLQPAVQDVVGTVGKPIRVTDAVQSSDGEAYIVSTGFVRAVVIQDADQGTNGPSVTVAVLQSNVFRMSWTPTVAGTARLEARAYDAASNFMATVGSHNLQIGDPPGIGNVYLSITNISTYVSQIYSAGVQSVEGLIGPIDFTSTNSTLDIFADSGTGKLNLDVHPGTYWPNSWSSVTVNVDSPTNFGPVWVSNGLGIAYSQQCQTNVNQSSGVTTNTARVLGSYTYTGGETRVEFSINPPAHAFTVYASGIVAMQSGIGSPVGDNHTYYVQVNGITSGYQSATVYYQTMSSGQDMYSSANMAASLTQIGLVVYAVPDTNDITLTGSLSVTNTALSSALVCVAGKYGVRGTMDGDGFSGTGNALFYQHGQMRRPNVDLSAGVTSLVLILTGSNTYGAATGGQVISVGF